MFNRETDKEKKQRIAEQAYFFNMFDTMWGEILPEETQYSLDAMTTRCLKWCFASLDCKHFIWENFPQRLAGQHDGWGKKKTLTLETMWDLFSYMWHAHVGESGSLNDANVLEKSTTLANMLRGHSTCLS